jgi:hypothetical protein
MVKEKFSDNSVESFLHSHENKESAEFDNHSDLNFDIYAGVAAAYIPKSGN